MNSEEKMRSDFEAFYMSQDQNAKEHLEFIREGGEYGYHVTRCAWNAWKSSRESLVIELPEAMECDDGYPTDDWLESNAQKRMLNICRESIHAAGVKTK